MEHIGMLQHQHASLEICEDDLDGDGVIGVNDLMQLLSSFGLIAC